MNLVFVPKSNAPALAAGMRCAQDLIAKGKIQGWTVPDDVDGVQVGLHSPTVDAVKDHGGEEGYLAYIKTRFSIDGLIEVGDKRQLEAAQKKEAEAQAKAKAQAAAVKPKV